MTYVFVAAINYEGARRLNEGYIHIINREKKLNKYTPLSYEKNYAGYTVLSTQTEQTTHYEYKLIRSKYLHKGNSRQVLIQGP